MSKFRVVRPVRSGPIPSPSMCGATACSWRSPPKYHASPLLHHGPQCTVIAYQFCLILQCKLLMEVPEWTACPTRACVPHCSALSLVRGGGGYAVTVCWMDGCSNECSQIYWPGQPWSVTTALTVFPPQPGDVCMPSNRTEAAKARGCCILAPCPPSLLTVVYQFLCSVFLVFFFF